MNIETIFSHNDPIGPLGAYGLCPKCGASGISWEPKTDVSTCTKCGWENSVEAAENRKKRRRNGEIR